MGLATDITQNCNKSIQVALEQIEFFQYQVKIYQDQYHDEYKHKKHRLMLQCGVSN